jgi:hypothetical protein
LTANAKTPEADRKSLVREFLEKVLGWTVCRLLGRHPPRPDIYAVIQKNGQKAILEIELVEYQVDTSTGEEGGSPGERLNSFWRKVQARLCRRLSKKPVKVEVRVTLKEPSKVKINDAGGFAEELVRLARGFVFPPWGTSTLTAFQPEFHLLARYIRTVTLKKVSYYTFAWTCADASAANVGISPRHVADLVRKKATKTYSWAKKAEKWLLICASGRSVVARAGSPPAPTVWRYPELQAACRNSPFDRVFFCDLPRRWYEVLK